MSVFIYSRALISTTEYVNQWTKFGTLPIRVLGSITLWGLQHSTQRKANLLTTLPGWCGLVGGISVAAQRFPMMRLAGHLGKLQFVCHGHNLPSVCNKCHILTDKCTGYWGRTQGACSFGNLNWFFYGAVQLSVCPYNHLSIRLWVLTKDTLFHAITQNVLQLSNWNLVYSFPISPLQSIFILGS